MKERIVNASLAKKIRYSYLLFTVPMMIFIILGIYSLYYANTQYKGMIQSATVASKFGLEFKEEFDYETYLLIVGNKTPEETSLYDMITHAYDITQNLEDLAVTEESLERIESLRKYLQNLEHYVDRIVDNLKQDDMYEVNIQIWENDVQIVTSLLNESMNEYLYYEIQNIQIVQADNEARYQTMINGAVLAMALIGIFIIICSYFISESIAKPIRELSSVTNQVAKGDLSVRARTANGTEVRELSTSLNYMIERIDDLLDEVRTEQIHLREAELELLQSQINPHFLYNTLDAIVWLAETGNQKQVVSMVESLSDFFRISLNNGKDIITIEEEIHHVTSYLEVQQVRYQDILTYEIDMEPSVKNYQIPKISLQPLVENALYHGIKNKRGVGKIIIRAFKEGDNLILKVIDNGIGMTEETLEKVRAAAYDSEASEHSSYGLYNVNERIRLKFGDKCGIFFESVYKEGTTVTIKLPCVAEV